MPFDINNPASQREEQRRLKKSQETSQQQVAAAPPNSGYDSVTTVDYSAHGTLSAANVLYLSGLSPDQKELARLGRLFARNWAIPPMYVFGKTKPGDYTSPITGQHLTIQEARQFSNNFGAVPVASMLEHNLTYQEGSGYKTARGQQQINKVTIDPTLVGKFAKVIADHGPDMKFEQAMGTAIALARQGINPNMLANNIDLVNQWWQRSGQGADPELQLRYAVSITATNHRLKSVTDVSKVIAGKGAVQASKSLNNTLKSIHTLQSGGQTVYVSDFMPGQYFNTQQEAQDAVAGEFTRTAISTNQLDIGILPEKIVGPDYWDQVQQEADRIKADQSAFENSWFNKFVLKPVEWQMHAAGVLYNDAFGGAVYALSYPVAGLAAAGSAIYDPQGDSPGETFKLALGDGHYQAQRLFSQQSSPGNLIAEPMGEKYSHWVGPALDFAIGWELDPLVVAGKLRTNYLQGFLLPGILDHGRSLDQIIEAADKARGDAGSLNTFIGHLDKFAKSRASRSMFEGDTTNLGRTVFRLRGKVEARGTLDLPFMTALKSKIDQAISEGMSKEDAWKEWQQGVKAHYLGSAPEGSIAQSVIDARVNEGFRATTVAEDLKPGQFEEVPLFYQHNGDWVSQADHQALMADAMGVVQDSRPSVFAPGSLSVEVPGSTFLSEYGPRRLIRSAISSDEVTKYGIGRRLAALPNMNPGRILDFNDRPWEYIYEHTVRTGAFNESEARAYASRMAEILNSGRGTETRTEDLINEINNEFFTRATKNYGLSPDELDALKTEILRPQSEANAKFRNQTFGVIGKKGISEPMLESQLRNQMFVMDPVVMRQGIRHYITMRDRLFSLWDRNVLGKVKNIVPALENADRATRAAWWAKNTSGDLFQMWLRFWKSLTVARPAYVTRVVLGDENMRFLATTSSVQDRLLSIAWGHRASEDNRFQSFLNDAFGSEMHIGDDTIPIQRAGAMPYESAAAGQVRQSDVINELLRGRDTWAKAMKTDGSWDAMVPSAGNAGDHLYWWSHDLANQARQSEPGSIALRSIADGGSVQDTKNALIAWARNDRFTTLRSRIGVDPDQVDEWADRLSKVMHSYTANSPEIAGLALEGNMTNLQKAMQRLIPDVEKRPIIHSPTLVDAVDGGMPSRMTNKLYDWFVRQPEDSLNRQPFYSVWKRRSEVAMYRALGQTAPEGGFRKLDVFHVPGRRSAVEPDLLDHPAAPIARPTVGDAEGYVYHGSPVENASSIVDTGIEPRVVTDVPPEWIPEHMQGGRAFYADSLERAKELQWKAGDSVMFRTKAAKLGESTPEELFSGSQWVRKTIKPDEFLANDGQWHPIADFHGKFVDPVVSRGIDNASRDFALGQVRRVMFDFTKQSRFTELLQFVFPFPQPFFEGFQAWGHIAYRNPTALVHGKQLFDLGVKSGFFKKDPQSGEYEIPAYYPYRWALDGLAQGLGVDPKLASKIASPWIPATSMNMLTSSTVKFGAEGPLGKAIGGVPLPIPGMHPPLQAFLQWANRNTTSPLAQGYLFQYGPSTQLFPRPVVAAAGVLGIDLTNGASDSSKASLALSITEAMHRYGMDVDGHGNPIPLNEQERQHFSAANPNYDYSGPTLEQIANDQAAHMLAARNLLGLFTPGAARVAFEGQREDYAAFQTYIDNNGGDYQKAVDQWMKDNATDPSKWFVPAGKTLAGEGYGDGNTAVRLPPSELVYQMYRMPGIGDLMRANKQWAALMLVGTDPEVQSEQNFMAFSDLIAKGDIRYKTPAEYYQSGVDGAGWAAYNEWKQAHYAHVEHEVNKYGSYASWQSRDSYKEYVQQRHDFFNQMYTTNPHWVVSNLVYSPETQSWDWPNGEDTSTNDTIAARADLQHLVNEPNLAGFPGVDAMKNYVDQTNALRAKMSRNYLNDINSDRAKDLGLWSKYQNIVKDTIAAAPDTQYFLSKYFNVSMDDKGKVASTGDLVFNTSESEWRWNDVPQNLRDNLVQLDQKLYDFKNQARESAMSPLEVAQDYNKADNLMRRTWEQDPKVLQAWWKSRNTSEQQDYKEYAAIKNIEYWTPFDFATIPDKGNQIKLGKQAQHWLQQWSDARLTITKLTDQNQQNPNSNFSASALYDQVNAHLRSLEGKNKGFDQVIKAANTWGWGIDHVLGYGVKDPDGSFKSEADHIWYNFLKLSRQAQDAVNRQGLQGVTYDSDANIKIYRNAQDQARAWVEQQRKHNAAFDQQWRQLNELNGDPIIGSIVLPDDYFGPLGSVNYGG